MTVSHGVWKGVCLAAGLLLLAAPAAADYTIEQTSSNGITSSSPSIERGQSFTTLAGGRGEITQVDFQSDTLNNTCSDFSLRIYAGDQSPDNPSAALYTESFTGVAGEWKQMTLSNPFPVDPSTQYTWEIKASNCSNLSLRVNINNPYAGGQRWSDGNPVSGHDYAFRVYVFQPTVSVDDLDGDALAYNEGDGAVIIDQATAASVTDSDSTGYIGGSLAAVITSGGVATEDQLSFDTSGTVALAGTTAGSAVSVGGVVVGNLRNDIDVGNDLVVILNGNATDALLTTLVQAITYENTNTVDPTSGTREVSVTVSDAGPGITQVDFQSDTLNNNCSDFHLRIYAGDQSPDNPSVALYEESFTGVAGQWKQMVLSTPVPVAPSTQYTWEIKAYNCTNVSLRKQFSDVYAGGRSWMDGNPNSSHDYPFHVYIETPGIDYTIDQTSSNGTSSSSASIERGQSFTTSAGSGSDTSIPAIVTVNVNLRPTANAGGPYVGSIGGTVTLDGSNSSDSDGSVVAYSWSVNGSTVYSGGLDTYTVTLTSPTYAAGQTYTVQLIVTDDDGAQSVAATTTLQVVGVDLAVSKSESVPVVTAGSGPGNLTYTVTVTNNGPDTATGIALSEVLGLPAGVSVDSATPSQGSVSGTSPNYTWTVGTLTNGASATLTVTLTVDSTTAPGTDVISDTATVTAVNETDTNGANDSATEATSVIAPTSVTATKAVSGSVVPGETAVYTVVLSNAGPADATDDPAVDEFTDVLPSELTLVSASATSGTAAADTGTNTVTWNGGIPAGSDVTITIQATIGDLGEGTQVSNQGNIVYDADGDGTSGDTGVTDDPATSTVGDATVFGAGKTPGIPVLGSTGAALLIVLMALAGAILVRRRLI